MAEHDTLQAEADSWLISDPKERAEKFRRERIRHYKLVRDLLLDKLGTQEMSILEVGGGPMPVSDLLPYRRRVVIDPLSYRYAEAIPCPDHISVRAEAMIYNGEFDLAIATNSLDHVEDPFTVVARMEAALGQGGYLAILCAENNAITHPHPAHVHNLTAATMHEWLDDAFETVWELTYAKDGYRYGWVPFEGKRGQPAFAMLMRRCY